jgi:hypothetical protein
MSIAELQMKHGHQLVVLLEFPCDLSAWRAARTTRSAIRRTPRTGCSSGGKSTLLDDLGRHGYAIVEEPGGGDMQYH